ncbi:MAG: ferritin-like domain-containing protein [Solirubrobacterales bacterium]|nr:ferritin-like domain-containing protein [Solirubrobacterales bacterium]
MASSQLVAGELAAIEIKGVTREAFLIRTTLAAAATYGALSATPFITRALAEGGGGDVDILNYALTLEYLEAEFYTLGAKQVKGLSGDEMKLVKELRDNEDEHVDALAATVKKLGGKAVKKPTFNFGGAFGGRAVFLKTANTLEDAGVSAYNGAGPLIESGEVLGAAGSIVQIEARHAALIRLVRNKPPAPLAFDKAADMDAILKKIKPFIKS